ncbi:site-2 protease family protein [Streptomyces sp. NPDC096142]|uniref:site-2 protease family protein n=1 Tax=Streptomyces sp. NPDC096142 TaxID=3366077 RepID=UPI0037F4EEFC
MDESGGSGQPRSGTNEPTEHATGATTPAPDPGTHESQPEDTAAGATPQNHEDTRPEAHADASASPEPAAEDRTGEDRTEGDRTQTESASRPPTTDVTATPSAPGTRDQTDPTPAPTRALNGEPKPDRTPTGPTGPTGPTEPTGHERTHDHDLAPHHTYAHTEHTGQDTPSPDARIAKGRPPQRPKEPGGGLLMGRPFGVPVYVAPSWFLVAALITWVFGGQLDRVLPELGAARYLVALFFAVAFYGSVLVHELAHTVAALRFKLPVRRIQLQFFGGVSEIEKEAETPGREFVLAFVGPLLSLVLAGVFYLAMLPVEPGTVPGVLLAGLMVSNLIVAAFNLLPGLPLDGGRMLRAVVWKITGRPMSGTIAAAWVGRALAVSVLIGLPLLTQTGVLGTNTEDINGMDTVTDALLAAILAAIIWTGAGNSLRMARLREHLPELRARNLTRRAVPVETDTPLSEALRRANAAGARALVVVDADGEPLSLVREAAIVGVPEHRRPWVSVSGLAQDLTDGMRVSAELAGEDLLDVLRATPATEYLVIEETGEIYGVLSAADVERAFVKAMARPS